MSVTISGRLKGGRVLADLEQMELTIPVAQHPPSSGLRELTTLIYVSSAIQLFSPQDLRDLLKQARHNNERLGITGMLLYKDGNFMQALEGPGQEVRNLYLTIGRDARHRNAINVLEYSTQERQFSDWTMGFTNLDGVRPSGDTGYSDILNQPLNSAWFREDPTRAQKLLASFRKNM